MMRPGPGALPGGSGGGRPGWRVAISALEHREYRWLFTSNMAFFFGMNGQMVVRSFLAFKLTESPFALGLIGMVVALPMIFIAPFGGVIADRLERRSLILAGQAVIVAGEFTVMLLLVTGLLEFWHLMAAAVVMGCVFPFIMPARQAIVVNIVGKRGLANAMALSMSGMNASRVVAPAVAGLILGVFGIDGAYMWGVGLYAIGLLCVTQVSRSSPPNRMGDASILQDIAGGVRYMRDHRVVLILLLFGLVPMFLAMPFQTLLVVFTEKVWEVGAEGLGFLNAIAGVGGFLGSMWVAYRAESGHRLRSMMVSVVLFGSFVFGFALTPWFLLALPLVLAANVFASVFTTLNNTAIQLLIPDHVRGRVSSFLMMSFGLPMLGTLPMSALAEVYGAPLAVALAAALSVAAAVVFYAGSRALRNLDQSVHTALLESDEEVEEGAPLEVDEHAAPGELVREASTP